MIPANYWEGTMTVEFEYPWITPGAICELSQFIQPHYDVLEFGSGGSTLFFARRCRSVTSFETLSPWYEKMKTVLSEKKIGNAKLVYATNIEDMLKNLGSSRFDVVLIDCVETSRVDLAMKSPSLAKPGGVVIVDNYRAEFCKGIDEFFRMKCTVQKSFDDLHWVGEGTKLYYLTGACSTQG